MRTKVNTLLRFTVFMVFSLGYYFYYSIFLSKCNTCDIQEKVLHYLNYVYAFYGNKIFEVSIYFSIRGIKKRFVLTSLKNDEFRKNFTYFRGIIT